jgi:hypothetical protein
LSQRAAQRPEAAEPAAEDIVPANVSPVSLGLALAGALVMLIAIFLPRVESPRSFARIADNTLIQAGGGWWFVGLAGAIGTVAWYAYRSNSRAAGTLVLGVIAIGVAVYYGKSHGSLTLCPIGATEITAACETASPGVGIYAAGVGGLLAAIGGLGIWRAPAADETVDAVDDAEPSSPGEAENDLAQRLRTLTTSGLKDCLRKSSTSNAARCFSIKSSVAPQGRASASSRALTPATTAWRRRASTCTSPVSRSRRRPRRSSSTSSAVELSTRLR